MVRRLYNIEFILSGETSILEMLTPSITEMMTTHSIDAIETYGNSMGEFEPFILDIVKVLQSHLPNQYESIIIHKKQSSPEIRALERCFLQALEKRICHEIKKRFKYEIKVSID